MSVKMRNNKNESAVCCECGESQEQVLNMFDVCIGGNIFTICDRCNEELLKKCLSAECMKNARTKTQKDMVIIRRRKKKERNW